MLRSKTTAYRLLQAWGLDNPVWVWAAGELGEEVLPEGVLW